MEQIAPAMLAPLCDVADALPEGLPLSADEAFRHHHLTYGCQVIVKRHRARTVDTMRWSTIPKM